MQLLYKSGHETLFCFTKKSHESEHGHPLSYFYKKHYEHKKRNMSTSYFCSYDPREKSSVNICQTNNRGSKSIWVTKFKP